MRSLSFLMYQMNILLITIAALTVCAGASWQSDDEHRALARVREDIVRWNNVTLLEMYDSVDWKAAKKMGTVYGAATKESAALWSTMSEDERHYMAVQYRHAKEVLDDFKEIVLRVAGEQSGLFVNETEPMESKDTPVLVKGDLHHPKVSDTVGSGVPASDGEWVVLGDDGVERTLLIESNVPTRMDRILLVDQNTGVQTDLGNSIFPHHFVSSMERMWLGMWKNATLQKLYDDVDWVQIEELNGKTYYEFSAMYTTADERTGVLENVRKSLFAQEEFIEYISRQFKESLGTANLRLCVTEYGTLSDEEWAAHCEGILRPAPENSS